MNNQRKKEAEQFLAEAGWKDANRAHLAGDASNRSYLRLTKSDTGESLVFMDAPPEKEDVVPFINIAQHLNKIGLSAPKIFAQNTTLGFLLIEDFGDSLFAKLMEASPQDQVKLYSAAAELLVHLHTTPPPDNLLRYCPHTMAENASPVFDQYYLAVLETPSPQKNTILALLETVLNDVSPNPTVLSLRDYHAENLLWLPDRSGIKRVGLLDFQDAVIAHPAYDLVSLLEDARRDVPINIRQQTITHYVELSGANHDVFYAAYCAQGAQRNLRILGIFTRLCIERGKPDYINLIPRVWNNLMLDLEHHKLVKLKELICSELPKPTPEVLQRLKEKCMSPL